MGKYVCKTYVVMKADRDGYLYGAPLAVKLTYAAAHKIAKRHVPARVFCLIADKNDSENGAFFHDGSESEPFL